MPGQSTEPRVLLVSQNKYASPFPVFPLGIAHLQASLERAGCIVSVHDCLVSSSSLEQDIAAFAPHVVGVSVRNVDNVQMEAPVSFIEETVMLARRVRESTRAPLVLGGAGFSIFPREFLDVTGADYGICGEGESAFVELVKALESQAPAHQWPRIPGLVARKGNGIEIEASEHINAEAIATPNPDPAWVAAYLERGSMMNLQTQRGCALRCCFCTYPVIEGRCYRRRPAEAIVSEMARYKELGAKYVFFVDSVFNTSNTHVDGICEALIAADLGLDWGCFMSPRGLSPERLRLARRAGLKHVEFGSDSFCDAVLERYGKHFRFEDILKATEAAEAAGLHHAHFLIAGGPGETPETLETTFENSRSLPNTIIFAFTGMRIYPQTPIWHELVRTREVPANMNLLAPYFYLSPQTPEPLLQEALQRFSRGANNWITGEQSGAIEKMLQQLRARGRAGPLWEFVALARRMQA